MGRDSSSCTKLRWYQRIAVELLWGICRIVGYSPRWFRFYCLRPFLASIFWLIRYRRKVILRNLRNAFPELSEGERKRIMRRNYLFLAEIAVCTIMLASVNSKLDGDLITWPNFDEHQKQTNGRDWIALASHYGCWEYFMLYCWSNPNCRMLGVYHPLRSAIFEELYQRFRNLAPNIDQVAMKNCIRHYIRHRGEERPIALGLISDQSPILRPDTEWIEFFGQPTAFIDGGEKIAMKFRIPAYFTRIDRVAVGRYAVTFEEVFDGEEQVEEWEITRRYAERLEAMIRRRPELWLWSHNRWRHTPEKQAKRFGKSTLKE